MKENNTNWPTLAGRLRNGHATELEALEQLAATMPLSEHGKKRLAALRKKKDKLIKHWIQAQRKNLLQRSSQFQVKINLRKIHI